MLRPKPVGGREFTVTATGPQSCRVEGTKPLRWVRQTDFNNEEAVGFLADRLAKLGRRGGAGQARRRSRRRGHDRRRDVRLGADAGRRRRAIIGPRGTDGRRRTAVRARRREQRHAEFIERHTPYEELEALAETLEDAPRVSRPLVAACAAGRGQGRIVLADHRRRRAGRRPGRRARRRPRRRDARHRAGLQRRDLGRASRRSACARRPRDLATLQACASVGQLLLAERYAASFARYARTVGQVLLTSEDVIRRAHYRNARRTLERLLALGVVPVLNENDAVATDEIRFSDNDRLAALVAHLVAADLLVLLTDVDGVYERNPRTDPGARQLTEVRTSGRSRRGRLPGNRERPPSARAACRPRSTRPCSPRPRAARR